MCSHSPPPNTRRPSGQDMCRAVKHTSLKLNLDSIARIYSKKASQFNMTTPSQAIQEYIGSPMSTCSQRLPLFSPIWNRKYWYHARKKALSFPFAIICFPSIVLWLTDHLLGDLAGHSRSANHAYYSSSWSVIHTLLYRRSAGGATILCL